MAVSHGVRLLALEQFSRTMADCRGMKKAQPTAIPLALTVLLAQQLGGPVFAQAQGDCLENILRKKEVRVGIMLIVPPLGFRDARNEPTGFDVEIAMWMAEALGVKRAIND
jgi:ABC-type amino acid transport substrate-binding protein